MLPRARSLDSFPTSVASHLAHPTAPSSSKMDPTFSYSPTGHLEPLVHPEQQQQQRSMNGERGDQQQEFMHFPAARTVESSEEEEVEDEPRRSEHARFPSSSVSGRYRSGTTSSAPTSYQTPPLPPSTPPHKPSRSHARHASGGTGPGSHRTTATTSEEERADLTNWAPEGQLPVFGKQQSLQLPDFLAELGGSTSRALGPSQVQLEMEESINGLLSEKVFEELMRDPLGRHRFREYLYMTSGDIASFDLWTDLTAFKSLTQKVKTTAIALHDVLDLSLTSDRGRGALSAELREDVLRSLRQGRVVGDRLHLPQQHLLQSLYASEFQNFIRHKLIEEASVRLGQVGLSGTGLGDAFRLTNPRLRDHPITLVSPGFERLTGYSAKFITGRNCRFLTGPATSPNTSKRIHDALNRGEGINTLVLNYRRNGSAFWNLLCIIPLRDTAGNLTYFLGGQTEVTGSLAHGKNLSWLVGSEQDPSSPVNPEEEFSPSLRAYASAMVTGSRINTEMVGTIEAEAFCAYGSPGEGLAGGQVPKGRVNEWVGLGEKKGMSGFKGLLRALTGGGRKEVVSERSEARRKAEGQQIQGAEALFSKKSRPVELQIAQFASVYSKVIIFRRKTREILFITGDLLAYCGLPSTPPMNVYRSGLIHTDILSLVAAPEHGDYKMTRRHLKDAIAGGRTTSLAVGIKTRRKSQYEIDVKYGTLHLSPLVDRDGVVEAFVAIFG